MPEPVTPARNPETAEEVIEDVVGWIEPTLDYLISIWDVIAAQYLSADGLLRLAIISGCGLVAYFLTSPVRDIVHRIWPTDAEAKVSRSLQTVNRLIFPTIWSISLWMATGVLARLDMHNDLLRIAANLLNAWVLIHLFSSIVRDPLWARTFTLLAWTVAALSILRLLNPTIALLDSAAITVGATRLSVYMILKGGAIAFVLLWIATFISRFVLGRVQRSTSLTPSIQTLIGHTVRIGSLFLALMLALNVIGIDLTALAVFSGAIGIGIGFGLQAIFSNLVAGIIMLFDGSIKVGDFVDLDTNVTGEVKEINIRSTRITTNDNVDVLVPNSEFINNRLTNWTLRDAYRRVRIPFGVAYGTDKELVKQAALEAAATVPHELTGRHAKPADVWLTAFGESSLDFELVVWIKPESVKSPSKVIADYYWALESAFRHHGIEIPYPQRDVHLRSGEFSQVTKGAKTKGASLS